MSKAIKTLAIATIIVGFASVAVAQRYGYPDWEGASAATYAGDAATNQFTSRAGLVDGE